MKKVFKYVLEVSDIIRVSMPAGAKPLHFDMQNGRLCLWALVTPANPEQFYQFRMASTGRPIDTCGEFINTLILYDRALVVHFFHA